MNLWTLHEHHGCLGLVNVKHDAYDTTLTVVHSPGASRMQNREVRRVNVPLLAPLPAGSCVYATSLADIDISPLHRPPARPLILPHPTSPCSHSPFFLPESPRSTSSASLFKMFWSKSIPVCSDSTEEKHVLDQQALKALTSKQKLQWSLSEARSMLDPART